MKKVVRSKTTNRGRTYVQKLDPVKSRGSEFLMVTTTDNGRGRHGSVPGETRVGQLCLLRLSSCCTFISSRL